MQVDGSQVPISAPGICAQSVPTQQSAELVHSSPCGTHTGGGAQVPLSQMSEQHCADDVQASSMPRHVPASVVGTRQVPLTHVLPAQQATEPEHAPPTDAQVLPWQVRMPPSPGKQRRPSQH